jgi:hypothetical protein
MHLYSPNASKYTYTAHSAKLPACMPNAVHVGKQPLTDKLHCTTLQYTANTLQTVEERAALEEEVTRLRRTLDSQRTAAADAAALAAGAAAAAAEELRSVRARLDAAEAQLQPIREALAKEQVRTAIHILFECGTTL